MVEVIYIATDDYSKYFEGFAETIKYFLPGTLERKFGNLCV